MAEGEPLTQHVAAPDQPLPDRVATPAPVVTHVNSASQSQHTFLSETASY